MGDALAVALDCGWTNQSRSVG